MSAPPLDTLSANETPEGIALALRPAGVLPRLCAYAIDLVVRGALLFVASLLLAWLGRMGGGIFLLMMFVVEWFYPVVFELTLAGATPGKRALGLRVVMDSGLPVTPAASLLRNLLRGADFLPFAYGLAIVSMLMRTDFKRLGDIAAGTLVVHVERTRLHGALPEAEPAAPRVPLSPRAQAAVIAWASRSKRLTPARLDELALLAAPATGTRREGEATRRLAAVAQWLMGHRPKTP